MRDEKIQLITKISIFSALSTILYMLKFPVSGVLPFMPSFLEIQFSNLPVLIGGFALGPIPGLLIVVVRTLLKLPFTHTFGVGELADLVIGISLVLVTSLIYRTRKSKTSFIIALILGCFVWIVIGALSNYFFILPMYMEAYGFKAVYGMLQSIPGITEANYMIKYILIAIVPFNLILSVSVSLITILVYKRISHLMDF